MNEQRNFILAIGLSILVLLVWQYFIGSNEIENQNETIIASENTSLDDANLSDIPVPSLDDSTDINADIVVPVPDSGVPAAFGYAEY